MEQECFVCKELSTECEEIAGANVCPECNSTDINMCPYCGEVLDYEGKHYNGKKYCD